MQENEKLLHITSKETAITRRNRENGKINIYKWYIWKRVDNQPMKGLPQFTSYNKHTHTHTPHTCRTHIHIHTPHTGHTHNTHTSHRPRKTLRKRYENNWHRLEKGLVKSKPTMRCCLSLASWAIYYKKKTHENRYW